MSKTFYRFLCAVLRPVYGVLYPARVDGLENIPAEGAFILCCNHIAARDPFYLAIREKRRYFHFMAKAELFEHKVVGAVLRGLDAFPVDRGHSDLNAVRTSMALLKDGHGLGIFPQGTRSRDNTRTPMLGGVSLIALRAKAPVIPCYIGGPYRVFRRTPVRFGAPVDLSDLGRRIDSDTMKAATQRIEDAVWRLKDAE